MNELFLYDLFGAILQLSTVIEGRFVVVKSGADINAPNHAQIVLDAVGGLTTARKYPVAVLLPPNEVVSSYTKGWSNYRLTSYWLTKDGTTGTNELKSGDLDTLLPVHPITYDWKDMRECAGNFRVALNNIIRQPSVVTKLRTIAGRPDVFERVSWAGNDKVNGVRLSFDLELFMPCELADYPADLVQQVQIPADNPHPLHKH